MSPTYALAAWIFPRVLAVIYLLAFVSLLPQALGLWGSSGIVPISMFLSAAERTLGFGAYWHFPTLFWGRSTDGFMILCLWLGIAASLLAFIGIVQGPMLLLCFILYLSFVSVGQDFLSFQWDNLLLEAGFLALFIAPWGLGVPWFQTSEPHWLAVTLMHVLLFKVLFSSGLVKLLSGDPAWRDLSALSYHYWTQPLPNWLSPFFHFLPAWFHKSCCIFLFVIELIVPIFIFFPSWRWLATLGILLLMALILISGNFAFFNWLTAALCIWLIPDSFWLKWLPITIAITPGKEFNPGTWLIFASLFMINLFWMTRFFMPRFLQTFFMPVASISMDYRISTPYGLFATMTKDRPEIVIEGSQDGETWKEYEFTSKPGALNRRPPMVAPYQPRLDWQMWFAAMAGYQQTPWLQNLILRLLQNSSDVLYLFKQNPFPDHPPKRVRLQLYRYEFTSLADILSGVWWKRTLIGRFSPEIKTSLPPSAEAVDAP